MSYTDPTGATQAYVSDAELMAWLEEKSNLQYGELRDAMNLSSERIDLIKRLNVLKADMQNAKTVDDFRGVRDEMMALVHDTKGTPYAEDMSGLFGDAIKAMDHPDDDQQPGECLKADKATVAVLKASIDVETDNLGKIDSLELVQIQQLVSDAKETSQLASNLFSSRDQTANSIVGNIRG